MKSLSLLFLFLISLSVKGQIVNGDFEQWKVHANGIPRLTGWLHQSFFGSGGFQGTWRDTPGQNGSYGLIVSRWYYWSYDFIQQTGSINYQPAQLSGYYKYGKNNLYTTHQIKDTAAIELYLTAWNAQYAVRDTIGSCRQKLTAVANYTRFTCPISYVSAATPDSFSIQIIPSIFKGQGGCKDSSACSFLTIDNLFLEQRAGLQAATRSAIRIYPNPALDKIYVDGTGIAAYYIRNCVGQEVLSGRLSSSENSIHLQTLPAGLYLIDVGTTEGIRVRQKLLKH